MTPLSRFVHLRLRWRWRKPRPRRGGYTRGKTFRHLHSNLGTAEGIVNGELSAFASIMTPPSANGDVAYFSRTVTKRRFPLRMWHRPWSPWRQWESLCTPYTTRTIDGYSLFPYDTMYYNLTYGRFKSCTRRLNPRRNRFLIYSLIPLFSL